MEFSHYRGAICSAFFLSWCVIANADDAHSPAAPSDFQMQRLLSPSPQQRASEERGSVYIYDSLEIGQVNDALDQQFDRMQNMMFIRINHLPPTGAGPAEVEDDGCD